MYWYHWYTDTLAPATPCLCAYMLLVPNWYCCLYVLPLLVHWYQPLSVSVPICYQYHTGKAVYMYWHCWYTSTLVPATLCAYMLPVPHWYCCLYVLALLVHWYTGTSHSLSLCLYVTGTILVLLFICTGTVGTLVRWY